MRSISHCGERPIPRGLPRNARTRWFIVAAFLSTVLSCWLLAAAAEAAATAEKVALTLAPGSIVADGTSTSIATATISQGAKRVSGHTVAFSSSDAGIHFSTTSVKPNGTYTATLTSSATAGTPTITATDTLVKPPASGQATLTQTPGPAKNIALSLQPGSIVADGSSYTTATATVADAHGNRVPTGNLVFSSSDPGESVLQVANNGNGTYSALIRSSTTPGQVTISATDTTVNLHVNAELTQTAGGSTLSLVAFPSAAVTNEDVTLFAVANSTAGSPSGTITFTNRGAPIAGCVAKPITPSSPTATCQTAFAASTSTEQLTAVFAPNAASNASGSTGTAAVTVSPDSTSTSLDVSQTVNAGAFTTYSTSVTLPPARPGPVEPSGSVEFFDGGQPIVSCLRQRLTNGGATCTVAYTANGTHSITARYGGDANFKGSTSPPEPVSVVPVPVHVLGTVTSTMQWSFYHTPTYTRVLGLVVNGASPGGTILIGCHGRGCPFAKRATAITKSRRCGPGGTRRCPTHGTINLAPALENHRFRVGARINVDIIRPGWIGKYYMFTIRSRQGPKIQIACLAPGGTRPGVGC